MFCPLSAEWGNVADWAGAIASFLAVVVALFIAFHESWSLKKERALAANAECLKMAHLKAEVIRLAGEIEAVVDDAFVADRRELDDAIGWEIELRENVEGCRLQLIALQQLAVPDPRLFGIIGRMIAETKYEFDARLRRADLRHRSSQIRKAMAERRGTIAELP